MCCGFAFVGVCVCPIVAHLLDVVELVPCAIRPSRRRCLMKLSSIALGCFTYLNHHQQNYFRFSVIPKRTQALRNGNYARVNRTGRKANR